ncbi:hypothetical protein NDU88_001066 [Pleurodeles waltl]|uniref:Uncharacterized protein n=1 Tax=Pleurodeles waltl TaxID=8319 RepID=A0AAV7WN67_PLEWA|nr:hypothetical protein NDU88_001066 [Pleurodeles waltl]
MLMLDQPMVPMTFDTGVRMQLRRMDLTTMGSRSPEVLEILLASQTARKPSAKLYSAMQEAATAASTGAHA